MRKLVAISILFFAVLCSLSFIKNESLSLRRIYSNPSRLWPTPFVDNEIEWKEIGQLPGSPFEQQAWAAGIA